MGFENTAKYLEFSLAKGIYQGSSLRRMIWPVFYFQKLNMEAI